MILMYCLSQFTPKTCCKASGLSRILHFRTRLRKSLRIVCEVKSTQLIRLYRILTVLERGTSSLPR
jgi:hypothetical protein